jgi:hypothetical protein
LTKRQVLSELASIFDPLGLLGPIVVKAKMFIQQLWQQKLDWNEPLSSIDSDAWRAYQDELKAVYDIRIDRCISRLLNVKERQLHGFCDASEVAYGACVYLRLIDDDNKVSNKLICSKSRVAPLKQQTIPRLELCGAVLLSRLMHQVTLALDVNIQQSYFWTDSTIVLSWIQSTSARFKVFVGNRVTEIQATSNSEDWRHVRTDVNPADCLSRGLLSKELKTFQLWWEGPKFLHQLMLEFPLNHEATDEELPEQKQLKIALPATVESNPHVERFEHFQRMIRVTAFII